MGIRFEFTGPAARKFTFLRGYEPPAVTDAAAHACLLDDSVWQGEGADETESTSMGKILPGTAGGIIGLFGLDKESAAALRASVCSAWPRFVQTAKDQGRLNKDGIDRVPTHVIDLGPVEDGNGTLPAISKNSVLRRLAGLCQLKDTTSEGLEALLRMINWSPPLLFLFDGSRAESVTDCRNLCAAIKGFRDKLETPAAKDHRLVVMMRNRDYLDGAEVKRYLPDAESWFPTSRAFRDISGDDEYPVRHRGQAHVGGAGNALILADRPPTPRQSIHTRLRRLVDEQGNQPVFVVGRPGTGKSVIQQQLPNTFQNALVVCRGFDRSDGKQYVLPLLRSLCRNLLARLGWDSDLPGENEDAEAEWQPFIRRLLTAMSGWVTNHPCWRDVEERTPSSVAARRRRVSRVVIGVDALDEAHDRDENRLDRLINKCLPRELPNGVHLIFTCRPETADMLNVPPTLDLDDAALAEDVDADLAAFLDARGEGLSEKQRATILQVAAGNFLVTALVLAFLIRERRDGRGNHIDEALAQLAEGQAAEVFRRVYDLYWQRLERFADNDVRAALGVCGDLLALAPAAVPQTLLAYVIRAYGIDAGRVRDAALMELVRDSLVERSGQGEQTSYALYHETFREYLRHKGMNDNPLRWGDARRHAADWCLERTREWLKGDTHFKNLPPADQYAVCWVAYHLCEDERWQDSIELLSDVKYLGRAWRMRPDGVLAWWRQLANQNLQACEAYAPLLKIDVSDANSEGVAAAAYVLHDRKHFREAAELFGRFIEWLRPRVDESSPASRRAEMAKALRKLSESLDKIGQPDAALAAEEEATPIFRDLGWWRAVAKSLFRQAGLLTAGRRIDDAKAKVEDASHIVTKHALDDLQQPLNRIREEIDRFDDDLPHHGECGSSRK